MNCNPFTNGHLYLIETASVQVEHLYIFVVEEDRSIFSFADRIRLVRAGVEHLENVTVLPSGKYIASVSTLPGYFTRENGSAVILDASSDLGIFAKYIAPCLDITCRFAGEEPIDAFTRQYNNEMSRLLPKYGIEFIEIKRKEIEGKPISASSVRAYMKGGQWEEIQKIVPQTTYEFLRNMKQEHLNRKS